MLRRNRLCALVWSLTAMLALATFIPPVIPDASAQGARTVSVQVGGGQDTMQALNFFPQNVRIRQGDTVTWRIVGDEVHTASFTRGSDPGPFNVSSPLEPPGAMIPAVFAPVPGAPEGALMFNPQIAWPTRAPGAPVERYTGGGYFNSGVFTKQAPAPGIPANDTFSLAFPNTGSFMYLCLIHPDRMWGTVEVVPTSETNVPSQAEIDQQASRELTNVMGLIQKARAQGDALVRTEPGPNGSTIRYVRAGNFEFESGDPRAHYFDFQPKNLVVSSGDTVVWTSNYFHSVTFTPTPPFPLFIVPVDAPSGPPYLTFNPDIVVPIKPTAEYDPTRYYNSGVLGPITPFGSTFSLTFTTPGTFTYWCQVHDQLGMNGTVTVQ
jgi:plastocyanin